MIFKWILRLIEFNTGRKTINQILQYLKPKLIQQMKFVKIIKKTKNKNNARKIKQILKKLVYPHELRFVFTYNYYKLHMIYEFQ